MSKAFAALCVLMGTIIGAGMLGLPYVISKAGFLIGAAHLIIVGTLMCTLMLYLGEIALRTKKDMQLPGYAQKYLGKKGRVLMFISLCIGIFSAVTAYLIAEGLSLSYLFFNSSAYQFPLGIAFWIFMSTLVYLGLKTLERAEMVGITLIFITLISIAVFFGGKINPANLSYINLSNAFIPFGVVLFAFLGFSAIPGVERVLGKEKKPIKKVIIASFSLITIVYLLFTLVVVGFAGKNAPEVATIALGKPFILLGMITMFTAYLSLSNAMVDIFHLDLNKSKLSAWFYTTLIPLAIFIILSLTKTAAFTKVLSIGGVISGAITVSLILSMVKKAKKKGDAKPAYSMPFSKWFAYFLIAFFIIGAIIEIIVTLR